MSDIESDSRQTAKTAVLNTVANVLSLSVGMVMIPIITRVISTEDLGMATTFVSTRNICAILFTLAAYSYVNKAMLEFREEKKDFIYSLLIFCAASVFFCFLCALLFKRQLMSVLSLDDFLFYWLFMSSFLFVVYAIANYYCLFHNKYVLVAMIGLSVGALSPTLSALFAYLMPKYKYIGRVLGLDFAYIVIAVCVAVWILLKNKTKFRMRYVARMLQFSVPVVPHLLSQLVLTQCDLIMINYFCGKARTGVYSIGHTAGNVAWSVVVQILMAWSPWVYRRLEQAETGAIYKNVKLVFLLGSYLSMGLLTISTELFRFFFSDEYWPCVYIVPPLVVAMFFQFVYMFFYDIEYYYKKVKWIAVGSVIASVLNIVLNLICIPRYGYIAACYTTLASYLVLLIVSYLFCTKLKVNKIYDVKFFLVWVCVVIAYAVVMMFCIATVWVRYGLFFALTVCLFLWKWKEMNNMLQLMRRK